MYGGLEDACTIYRDPHAGGRTWTRSQRALGAWLVSLAKPAGLMADNDHRARLLLDACRAVKLSVPDEVAVIGVDNDELLCQLSTPLLSSVEQGSRIIGYEAAALLDRVMSGQKPRIRKRVVDPVGVVARDSTYTLAIDDTRVAEAMRYISGHVFEQMELAGVRETAAI